VGSSGQRSASVAPRLFEIFFPLAGGEHQDKGRSYLRGANGGQEVSVGPVGEVFFAKDHTNGMSREHFMSLLNGWGGEGANRQTLKNSQKRYLFSRRAETTRMSQYLSILPSRLLKAN